MKFYEKSFFQSTAIHNILSLCLRTIHLNRSKISLIELESIEKKTLISVSLSFIEFINRPVNPPRNSISIFVIFSFVIIKTICNLFAAIYLEQLFNALSPGDANLHPVILDFQDLLRKEILLMKEYNETLDCVLFVACFKDNAFYSQFKQYISSQTSK